MRILLVRPWVNKKITTVKNFLFGEPLGIECVATALRELGHELLLVDFMLEPRGTVGQYMKAFRPDAVGVTSQCTDVENVLRIARAAKASDPRVSVVVGGVQATCFPEAFFCDDVDYVFRSTSRENLKAVFPPGDGSRETGLIPGVYSKSLDFINEGEFCLNEYIPPDRSSTARYREQYQYVGFSPCALIQTAYGCRNRCNFCIRWKLEGGNLRELPIGDIVRQIGALDEPYVMICDNDFLANGTRLAEFCRLLAESGISKKYICYGSVNSILEKPEAIAALARVGLIAVIVGYEAFDDGRMAEYNKAATVSDNKQATLLLQRHGIACWGSFILHPDWDRQDFRRLVRYIRHLKPELITFSPLVPHPMTALYEQYGDRLIYPKEDYDKWNFGDVLIRPSRMSLPAYYRQVVKLAFIVNLNGHSVAYTLRKIPRRNLPGMILGFRTLFGVYLRNMLTRK
jgi:radical SAM superfamily enzyme YgiQ (UPF0313 family)